MMRLTWIPLCLLLGLAIGAGPTATPKSPQTPGPVSETIETGRFRFYETKQLRGEETYTIDRSSDGTLIVKAKTEMPFAEQEKKPLVNSLLRMKADFSPLAFETKGPTLLEIEENTSVVVQGKTASVQDRGTQNTRELPRDFFTLSGYVPLTMEMMLVRYWLAHGSPAAISLLPIGEAYVEFRGTDIVSISGKPALLSRYHLSGKNWRGGWGRQTLWLDTQNRLVAAVNLGSDIETNLYAFRDSYETQTSFFLKRAVEDSIAWLTQLAVPKPQRRSCRFVTQIKLTTLARLIDVRAFSLGS
jgi:hypothetical protein